MTITRGNMATRATWEGAVIAESADCIVVDGYTYFPRQSVRMEYLQPSDQTSICSWKGLANYCDVVVNGKRNAGAAWYYGEPSAAAEKVRGFSGFWNGVSVQTT